MSTTPYNFIKRGQLFIIPVGPSINEVPYPTQAFTKPREYSLWVNGKINEPEFQLDKARMPPSLYQEVRDDLVRYSPVEVSRSAFRRSDHAYVGVIDSHGTPYYFALDSRGMSVREAAVDDERVWKTFDKLSDQERTMATNERRVTATTEMVNVAAELTQPKLIIAKGLTYGAKTKFSYKPQRSSWWRHLRRDKKQKEALQPSEKKPRAEKPPKQPKATPAERTAAHLEQYEARARGRQAVRDKLRAERKQKPAKPKADNTRLSAWRAKHPGGVVDVMHAHPFAKGSVDDHFAHVVQHATDHAPEEHGVGPHKVFIHHVHEAAKKQLGGMSIDEFKQQIPKHRQAGTLRVARADHVAAMDHEKVSASETKDGPAEHHFLMRTKKSLEKALPKKSKEKPKKKTPNVKASSKKVGAGGKPRYSYPGEKSGAKKPGARQPLLVLAVHDDSKHADPAELANQLNVSVRTLQHTAKRLGREGFTKFMRSHLKRFAAKHRLDPDYWGTLFERLHAQNQQPSDF